MLLSPSMPRPQCLHDYCNAYLELQNSWRSLLKLRENKTTGRGLAESVTGSTSVSWLTASPHVPTSGVPLHVITLPTPFPSRLKTPSIRWAVVQWPEQQRRA